MKKRILGRISIYEIKLHDGRVYYYDDYDLFCFALNRLMSSKIDFSFSCSKHFFNCDPVSDLPF